MCVIEFIDKCKDSLINTMSFPLVFKRHLGLIGGMIVCPKQGHNHMHKVESRIIAHPRSKKTDSCFPRSRKDGVRLICSVLAIDVHLAQMTPL